MSPAKPTLALALVLAPFALAAQCPGCAVDTSCLSDPPFPALCPSELPPATAGEPYGTDITFWLPVQFQDPGTGLDLSFEQMTITGVYGMPFGMAVETNSPNNTYFPPQNSFGCARICGTPLGPGTFPITIAIMAQVSFSGFSLSVPQQFSTDLVVLPGAGGNNSFTFEPASACGSAEVTFHAAIDASPQPMAWAWDFGNGNTSDQPDPPVQTYDSPGTYTVSLQTTVSSHVLQSVQITSVNGGWCNDVEEPLCNCGTPFIGTCPDLYFVLTDGNGNSYTSSTIDDQTSGTWNNLGLVLNNPPYSISFWDEDVVSADDHLGTYNITLSTAGTHPFMVANGTAGSLNIALQVLQQFNDTDLVHVLPMPEPVLMLNEQSGELCVEGDDLLQFIWLVDGDTVPDATGACIDPHMAGAWQVVVTNAYGCTATSEPWVICPSVTIVRTGDVLSVPGGFQDYTWTLNGEPLPNGDQPFMIIGGNGEYAVTINAPHDCVVTATFAVEDFGVGMTEIPTDAMRLGTYPVPNDGAFTVVGTGLPGNQAMIHLTDQLGRMVWQGTAPVVNGQLHTALMPGVAPGHYAVVVRAGDHVHTVRTIVR
jgi:hypothetical protein